jgi:tetratricopeptide (TPR) repeat protein
MHMHGDYDGAIALYDRILADDPDHLDALYERTFSTYVKGDFADTIRFAEKAVGSQPESRPGFYVFLGGAHGMLGDWKRGEVIFRRGLEIWPDDAPLHFNLGVSLGAQGDLDAAAGQFEEALRRSPYQAGNWRVLADTLDRAGRKGRAFAAYARSLTLEKGSEASARAARRLREMIFEGAEVVTGDSKNELRIGVRVPESASGDTLSLAATESMGMGLVAALRYEGQWKGKSESRFFVYAVDQVLQLLSALQPAGAEKDGPFWGPFVFSYFDQGREAGHMEAIAYDLLHPTGDLEAARWRREHGEQDRRYRDWSDRWAVDWSVAR